MKSSRLCRSRGFTLVEIMTVVLIVGLLSMLAVVVIGRIRDRAIRSMITNNLRQVYQAKEHYFLERSTPSTALMGLATYEYLRPWVKERLMSGASAEAHAGWHYSVILFPNEPVYAYKGQNPGGFTRTGAVLTGITYTPTTGEVIWYPDPPAALAPKNTTP
jgi:prepilin-type N-terminal cleavage/methylation domain-containing protein